MSRATFVALFLLTLPHVAEARVAGRETPMRATLICETDVGRADAPDPRSCIEPKPQQRFQQQRDRTLTRGHHMPSSPRRRRGDDGRRLVRHTLFGAHNSFRLKSM